MRIYDIILKKLNKEKLTKAEIEFFVKNYSADKIPDYQASALLAGIYINGMDNEETTNLTLAMANSSKVMDLSSIKKGKKIIVDKHSTGGVGDKVTLIVLPIVAALGAPVAKMSGRGLGFTGGTADKLESIKNMNIEIPVEDFIKQVKDINICLITQNKDIDIADKKMYALRDVTATVASLPLIASSVMSKKIAAGADKILLDVTCGSGAFMKTEKEAKELSKTMVDIGKLAGRETVAVVTRMDEPLGKKVGNSLEIEEAVEFLTASKTKLNNNIDKDLKDVVYEIAAQILKLAGIGKDMNSLKEKIEECITSKAAYNKFIQFIKAQGGLIVKGKPAYKEDASYVAYVKAEETGYISKLHGEKIGLALVSLGGGREKKEDSIDYSAGFIFERKTGDYVKKGDIILTVMYNDEKKLNNALKYIKDAIKIEKNEVKQENSHIIDVIS
ncbi:MAG: thymidine phosphorylase [Clostridia bacterium]